MAWLPLKKGKVDYRLDPNTRHSKFIWILLLFDYWTQWAGIWVIRAFSFQISSKSSKKGPMCWVGRVFKKMSPVIEWQPKTKLLDNRNYLNTKLVSNMDPHVMSNRVDLTPNHVTSCHKYKLSLPDSSKNSTYT